MLELERENQTVEHALCEFDKYAGAAKSKLK